MAEVCVPRAADYELMRDALNATGRPMIFSISSWGKGEPHLWHGQARTEQPAQPGRTERPAHTGRCSRRGLCLALRSPLARPASLLAATPTRVLAQVGHSWRTGRDLFAVWDEHAARDVLRLPDFLQSFMTAVEGQHDYSEFAGPGAFNDPDMLVVGLEGMVPYGVVR